MSNVKGKLTCKIGKEAETLRGGWGSDKSLVGHQYKLTHCLLSDRKDFSNFWITTDFLSINSLYSGPQFTKPKDSENVKDKKP